MKDALNPNHPVVQEMEDQWHKFCAALMFKFGVTEVVISTDDLESFANSNMTNIVVDTRGNHFLTLRLVSDEEGNRLARQEGGLPH